MKKLLTFSLFLSFVISMQAQEHRVSAGVSFGTLSQFHRALSGIISDILQDSNSIYRKETVNMGDFRVSYLYIPEGKINFGGTFSYNHSREKVFRKDILRAQQKYNYYTLAGESGIFYRKWEKTQLYGLLGVGATLVTTHVRDFSENTTKDKSEMFFNFQVTPIGVSFGKQWGGFAEIGLGYRGILSAGLFYNLK